MFHWGIPSVQKFFSLVHDGTIISKGCFGVKPQFLPVVGLLCQRMVGRASSRARHRREITILKARRESRPNKAAHCLFAGSKSALRGHTPVIGSKRNYRKWFDMHRA